MLNWKKNEGGIERKVVEQTWKDHQGHRHKMMISSYSTWKDVDSVYSATVNLSSWRGICIIYYSPGLSSS